MVAWRCGSRQRVEVLKWIRARSIQVPVDDYTVLSFGLYSTTDLEISMQTAHAYMPHTYLKVKLRGTHKFYGAQANKH